MEIPMQMITGRWIGCVTDYITLNISALWCVHTARHRHRDRHRHKMGSIIICRTVFHWPTLTLTPTQIQMGCKRILSVSVSVSVLVSVNTPLTYVTAKHSLAQMMLFKSPGAAGTPFGWHQVSTGVTSYHQANMALDNKLRLPCAPLHGFWLADKEMIGWWYTGLHRLSA